ncbi:hypothetical protein Aristophanes_00017 [Acinetobacter phage Aristophanes]|uniref:Uncharacterized protein n=1 Tax=Acinetobacter phage Aristophanes TaxID=2759203 RepID=A0A7G9VYM6_BPACA|nr:hypothetical protein Aristophanes_00017 [Acinetobacter phage Aristophanes]
MKRTLLWKRARRGSQLIRVYADLTRPPFSTYRVYRTLNIHKHTI